MRATHIIAALCLGALCAQTAAAAVPLTELVELGVEYHRLLDESRFWHTRVLSEQQNGAFVDNMPSAQWAGENPMFGPSTQGQRLATFMLCRRADAALSRFYQKVAKLDAADRALLRDLANGATDVFTRLAEAAAASEHAQAELQAQWLGAALPYARGSLVGRA